MPLQKVTLKPGVNRENTRYTNEGGWYESEKVRFRQGTPEKIGGWQRISASTFLGVCRSLWNWITLGGNNLLGIGTNLKFYIEQGGSYNDITPIRTVSTLVTKFTTDTTTNTGTVTTVTVTDTAGGFKNNDYVAFYGSGATTITFNGLTIASGTQYQLTYVSATTYTITVTGTASTSSTPATTPGTVYGVYQLNTGPDTSLPVVGWGAGTWGSGTWGNGTTNPDALRLWSQSNYGEDLLFGPRGGAIYYWDVSLGAGGMVVTMTLANPAVVTGSVALYEGYPITLDTTGYLPTSLVPGTTYYVRNPSGLTFNLSATPLGALISTAALAQSGTQQVSARGMNLVNYPVSAFNYAADIPIVQNFIMVSDASRFIFAFGTNDFGETTQDPMLIRWSSAEGFSDWSIADGSLSYGLRLSHGSEIVTAMQVRQEIVVWTDSSLYSLQFLGAPYGWGSQLLGDNVSIISQNAAVLASGVTFWMAVDKFYRYDGRVSTLRCDVRRFVFQDINTAQYDQVFAGTSEGFNEVWWFYCSASSNIVDRYVVYNYTEDIWYYGTMGRTAWLDSGLRPYPMAATYSNNIVNHESGLNDNTTGTETAIEASITSSQYDIGDGHSFGFVWRILPDITFSGSTATSPSVTMYLQPLQNSGSGYNNPTSEGGSSYASVTRTVVIPVEEFTGQIYTRVRGRQMSMKVSSNQLDTTWQLGSPRIDVRTDGRRGST